MFHVDLSEFAEPSQPRARRNDSAGCVQGESPNAANASSSALACGSVRRWRRRCTAPRKILNRCGRRHGALSRTHCGCRHIKFRRGDIRIGFQYGFAPAAVAFAQDNGEGFKTFQGVPFWDGMSQALKPCLKKGALCNVLNRLPTNSRLSSLAS
jgi:hypothetical protein